MNLTSYDGYTSKGKKKAKTFLGQTSKALVWLRPDSTVHQRGKSCSKKRVGQSRLRVPRWSKESLLHKVQGIWGL